MKRATAPLAALATVIVLGVVPSSALAGRYIVNACSQGLKPITGSEMLSDDGTTSIVNQCVAGHGFQMTFASNVSVAGYGNGFRFRVPDSFPHARIIDLTGNVSMAKRNGNPTGFFTIDETNAAHYDNGEQNPSGAQQEWPAGYSLPFGPATFKEIPGSPSRSIIWRVSPINTSTGGTTDFDPSDLGASFVLNSLTVTMDDPTPPLDATFTKTGLLDGSAQSGTRTLSVGAHDDDSGVGAVVAFSGSIEIARFGGNAVGDGCPYASVEACPIDRPGDLGIDTTKLANGAQTLRIVTTDASGNTTTTFTPVFSVSNATATATPTPTPAPGALPLNGDPKGTPVITASTSAKTTVAATSTSRSVAWHHPVTLTGRLLAADGTPMAGTTLDITQALATPGAATTKLTSITTDAKGVYRFTFKATSSAAIAVRYPGHLGGTDYTALRTVNLSVRAHVTLKRSGAAGRGKTLRFSGHVDAGQLPAGGARVAIQYHSRSGAWLAADVVTTAQNGNFGWKHAFATRGRYRLRAHVIGDKQLAAAPNNSAELRFRIR